MTNQADKPSGLMALLSEVEIASGDMIICAGGPSFYTAQERRDKGRAAIKEYAERLASESAAEELPPIAPVAWRFKDMAGNVHYAESVTPLAQSDITPLYSAPPSAVLLEVLEQAIERMDRVRAILTNDNPRPECNWGLLDTSDIRAALRSRLDGADD